MLPGRGMRARSARRGHDDLLGPGVQSHLPIGCTPPPARYLTRIQSTFPANPKSPRVLHPTMPEKPTALTADDETKLRGRHAEYRNLKSEGKAKLRKLLARELVHQRQWDYTGDNIRDKTVRRTLSAEVDIEQKISMGIGRV